jgi:hypothetical protein
VKLKKVQFLLKVKYVGEWDGENAWVRNNTILFNPSKSNLLKNKRQVQKKNMAFTVWF